MKTSFWGEVEPVGQRSSQVLVEELTKGGLSFRCDRGTSVRLMPSWQHAPGSVFGVQVLVTFSLPGLQKPVKLPCRVVFCRRYAQDSYRFDCEFDPGESLQQQRIEGFLRRQQVAPQKEAVADTEKAENINVA
jgi:hypothetical protein